MGADPRQCWRFARSGTRVAPRVCPGFTGESGALRPVVGRHVKGSGEQPHGPLALSVAPVAVPCLFHLSREPVTRLPGAGSTRSRGSSRVPHRVCSALSRARDLIRPVER